MIRAARPRLARVAPPPLQLLSKPRLLAAILTVLLAGPSPLQAANRFDDLPSLKRAVVANYVALVHATYGDALAAMRNLARAVDGFLDKPSAGSLQAARQAWIDSRVPYAQTEAYRFYDGPIEAVEGLINSWPIDENLIDYVDGEPDAGIVNQPAAFPRITKELIVSLNEKGGEKNITAGFHAIEFLLWGQDLNDDGPGQRSHLDYVDGSAPHADRRREYLRLTMGLLVEHVERVFDQWSPDRAGHYRARLLAAPPDEALAHILEGIGILSGAELAGERLTVAYETKEQEDEHSCFSDNTHRDLLYNIVGIRNVFLGRYAREGGPVEGPGVRDLLAHVDAPLAETLARQMDASLRLAEALPAPFDHAILGKDSAPGRVAVKALIAALRAQADSIARAGSLLGLTLSF